MAWYEIFYRVFNKKYRSMDSKFSNKSSFLRGMASTSSFHKRRSLEEYRNHINELTGWTDNPRERIGRCFHNVGTHIHNSMNSLADQNNLSKPSPFDSKIKYY